MSNEPLDQFDFASTGELVGKKDLINDSSILNKGIIGLIFCIMGGLFGLILVRICLNQSKDALEAYHREPHLYKESSFLRVKKGQRLGYVGLGIIITEAVVLVAVMSSH